ncbi:MAG: type II RES/Xre toxin-antitoxin system antitoxin [Bacteroidota bacterium]|uniref:Putative toxin-antitoxin system antitoxin component, TIGR02293 family n=1 Tax=Algoriphagus faecimaris TaxID=686796 RepID=A0A1G6TJX4_9BACT|nr:antitoxin Xre/MbcA/ParS toxin-binding domain-containing protein [Algoriphagus faecimaris]SDD28717.1 putative toxin-antitoxin system antitoxin component, TIGR02293 family [Algoriphagus faecimaris]
MSDSYHQKIEIVAEEMATYVTGIPGYSRFPSLRGVPLSSFFSDRMMVVDVIRQGIPTSLFMSFKDLAPFSDQEWSDFLDISLKSLQRYKKESDYVFRSIHSEKIIELMEVTLVGLEVFDSVEDFAVWLNTKSYALGDRRPIDLLRDSYGKELVLNELHRIDQGIFA